MKTGSSKFLKEFIWTYRLQIWVAGAAIHSRLHGFAKQNKFRNGFFLALAIAVDKRFSFVNGAELCMRDCAKR